MPFRQLSLSDWMTAVSRKTLSSSSNRRDMENPFEAEIANRRRSTVLNDGNGSRITTVARQTVNSKRDTLSASVRLIEGTVHQG